MAIAQAEKDNPSSKRFYFVKLTSARYHDSWTSEGGGIYSKTLTVDHVEKVQRNGVDLTSVSSTPGNNDEYYFNESTKKLEVKLASAPDSSSNVVIVFYNLYFTSHGYEVRGDNPENTTDLREWQPRILNQPVISQTVKDTTFGAVTLSSTAIELANVDNYFEDFNSIDDSPYLKEVKVWMGIITPDPDRTVHEISAIQKIFEGTTLSVNFGAESVTIGVVDMLQRLNQTAYFGDDKDECFFTEANWPNIYSQHSGTPNRMLLGTESKHGLMEISLGSDWMILDETAYQAVCTNFSVTKSRTTNREWHLCRVPSDGFRTPDVGTIDSFTLTIGQVELHYADQAAWDAMDLKHGDTIKAVNGGITDYYYVVKLDEPNLTVECETKAASSYGFAGTTFTPLKGPAIVIVKKDGSATPELPNVERDYTFQEVTSSGGNKICKITFLDNFEDTLFGVGTDPLSPETHEVYFRASADSTNLSTGKAIKLMLNEAGVTTKDSTFDSPNLSFGDTNVRFTIPRHDESDYGTYLDYISKILESAYAYLKINNDFEVEYKLIEAPGAGTELNTNLALNSSITCQIDYADVITQLIMYNPEDGGNNDGSSTLEVNKARYLHGFNRTVRVPHVLESVAARIQDIMDIRSNRRVIYSLATATANIDTQIGDDFTLKTAKVLGSGTEKNLKVVGIDKSADKVQLDLTDYGEL